MPGNNEPEKIFVTRFIYEKLLGYQCDNKGIFKVKVYEAQVSMSDGSTRIIYGTYKEGGDPPAWDLSTPAVKPVIHRDRDRDRDLSHPFPKPKTIYPFFSEREVNA